MSIMYHPAVIAGKLTRFFLEIMGRQASTLPGRVSLALDSGVLERLARNCRIVAVTGTNGKTTTTTLVTQILGAAHLPCHTNRYGANLASGLTTTLLDSKKGDLAVLEVDEAALAQCAEALRPEVLVVTNLSPDQMDRFGSLEHIIALVDRGSRSAEHLVLCLDNPPARSVGADQPGEKKIFFCARRANSAVTEEQKGGAAATEVPEAEKQQAGAGASLSDSRADLPEDIEAGSGLLTYSRRVCRNEANESCSSLQLDYSGLAAGSGTITSSFTLPGAYNAANAAAAVAAVLTLEPRISVAHICAGLETAVPQFGRLERIKAGQREVCLVLIKNEAGFAAAAEMLSEQDDLGGLLFVINNKPADGEDISWFKDSAAHAYLPAHLPYGAAGMCRTAIAAMLREKFQEKGVAVDPYLAETEDPLPLFEKMLDLVPAGKTLYVLPNYTAMMTLQPTIKSKLEERFKLEE